MKTFIHLFFYSVVAIYMATLCNCGDPQLNPDGTEFCDLEVNKFEVLLTYDDFFDTLYVTPYRHGTPDLKYNCTYKWNTGATTYAIGNPKPGFYEVEVTGPAPYFCKVFKTYVLALPGACNPQVNDSAGNRYPVVELGGNCWMAKNLIHSGKSSHIIDPTEWNDLYLNDSVLPAYCWYEDDNSDETWGMLYNWHAVKLGRICPAGWHVPSKNEWQQLLDSIRQKGGALKSKSLAYWDLPNTGSEQGYGFNLVGAGQRDELGEFELKKQYSGYWTSDESGSMATAIRFHFDHLNYSFVQVNKYVGLSCRCIKD